MSTGNTKSNHGKIFALTAKRVEELNKEIKRMEMLADILVAVYAVEGVVPIDLDAVYNEAVRRHGGATYGTEAQMVLDLLAEEA